MSEEAFPDAVLIPLGIAKEWEKRYQDDTTVEDPKTKVKSFLILNVRSKNFTTLPCSIKYKRVALIFSIGK